MSEETPAVRQRQTVNVVSYASVPGGWFLHFEYRNDQNKLSFGQVLFGPNANESQGVYPLWKAIDSPVEIDCPNLSTDPQMFKDYSGILLVPIPEVVIQTMFIGSPNQPRTSTIRRA